MNRKQVDQTVRTLINYPNMKLHNLFRSETDFSYRTSTPKIRQINIEGHAFGSTECKNCKKQFTFHYVAMKQGKLYLRLKPCWFSGPGSACQAYQTDLKIITIKYTMRNGEESKDQAWNTAEWGEPESARSGF